MKAGGSAKHFILAFVLALLGYAVCYYAIEHRRARNGPWEVSFTKTADGEPMLVIQEPKLALTNVQIVFAAQAIPTTNAAAARIVFDQPRPVPYDVPFGQCIFTDLTFLPGTVTFRLLGHEIELLPRVLMLDHEEHPWRSGSLTVLKR